MLNALKSLALFTALVGAGCKADLKVQTTQVASAGGACLNSADAEACAKYGALHLLVKEAYTNDPQFAVKWFAQSTVDASKGFELRLAEDSTCQTNIKSYTAITENFKALTDVEDNKYFLCLYGQSADGKEVAADNNGLPLTVDRTVPQVAIAEQLVTKAALALNPSITDLLATSFKWEKVSGPGEVTFSDDQAASPTVTMDQEGTYAIQVTVVDLAGNSTVKLLSVLWDTTPPVIAPIPDQLAGTPLLIDASVTATATDLPLMYSWSVVSGPGTITPPMPYPAEDITVSADLNGPYVLRLSVTDAAGNTATRNVNFYWDDSIPSVSVGSDLIANAPISIDANTNLASAWAWTQVSGPGTVTFTTPATEDTIVSADTDGVYVLRLSATNAAASETRHDDLTLTWDTAAPVFQAPLADQNSNTSINLSATVTDTLTTISYAWTKISGPGNVVFSNANASSTTATVNTDGTYVLRLTATDQAGNSTSDDMVYSYDATPPTFTSLIAINGANDGYVNASEAASTAALYDLTASDYATVAYTGLLDESTPQTCNSSKTYSASSVPNINDMTSDGSFVICVKLTDAFNNVTYGKSQVVVRDTVLPLVNVGGDLVASGTVNINASSSGAASYSWSKVAGSGNITFSTANAEDTTASADADDIYTLRLTVTDAAGNSAFDDLFFTRDTAAPSFTSLLGANEASDGWVNNAEKAATNSAFALIATGYSAATYTNFLDDSTPVTCDGAKTYGNGAIPLVNTIPATDAAYAVCVKLVDAANNITYGKSQVITRDIAAPVVNVGADRDAAASANIDATVSGATSYQWSKVSGPGAITFGTATSEDTSVSANIDGSYVLRLTATDAAGNSAFDELNFGWDTTAPVFTSLLGTNGASDGYINAAEASSAQPLLILSATGYTSATYTAVLDDSTPVVCDNTQTYGNASIPLINSVAAAEVPYAVCVKLSDAVGNTTYGKSQVITKDTTLPTVNAGADVATNAAIARDASSSDASTYAWSKVSGPGTVTFGTPAAEDTTIAAGTDGSYVLRLTVTDVAGNSATDDINFDWDTQAPVFTSLNRSNEASDGYVNSSDVSSGLAAWILSSSGASSIQYTVVLDETAPQTCDVNKTYSQSSIPVISALPAADKPYVICVALGDVAGNITYGKSQVITRDTVAPTVDVGSDIITNGSVSIDATTSGASSWAWTKQSGPGVVTFGSANAEDTTAVTPTDGTYVLRLTASDAAGNSSYDELGFIQSSSGTTITSFNGANEASNGYVNASEAASTNPMLTLNANNYDPPQTRYTVPLDNTSPVTCDVSQTYSQTTIPTINQLASDKPWVVCVKLVTVTSVITYGKSQVIIRDTVAPTVNVGPDQLRNATFGLDASTGGGATYAWTKQSGTGTITFGTPSAEDSSVSASADGTYVLRLTVTDAAGNTAFDELNFTWDTVAPTFTSLLGNAEASNGYINAAEISSTNPAFALIASNYDTVNYTSIFNDNVAQTCDGSKSYTQSSIPLINTIAASDASYAICAKLADNAGNITYGKSQVIVRDVAPPTVNVGADVSKNAVYSINASTGNAVSYAWTKQSGPGTITFGTPSAEDTTASASTDGTYVLRLTVTDVAGNTAYDELNFVWDTAPPTVNVGVDRTTNTAINIDATTSGGATYAWSKQSGTGTITFGTPSVEDSTASASAEGTFVLRLTVTDAAGNTAFDELNFTWDVTAPVFTSLNGANEASNGYINDAEKTSALAMYTLVASGYDNDDFTAVLDDTPSITCDGSKTYSNANIPLINAIPASDDSYAVCVKLSDLAGNITYGKSQTIVRDIGIPTVNAGADMTSNGNISVNATTGGATTWAWTKISGPGTVTFGTPSAEDTTVSVSSDGTYVLRLTVLDAAGNSAFDEMSYVKDTVAPTFTSLNGANEASNGYVNNAEKTSALAIATLVASGYDTVAYSNILDNNPSITCDNSQSYGNATIPLINAIPALDETYAVCVKLSDIAGNITYGKSQSIVLDTVAPTFTSLNGANAASDGYINSTETSSALAGFTLVASNYTIDDFTAFLDDNPSITCDSGKTYSNANIPLINTIPATDETYAVCVKLTDAAGNITYGKSQSIVRDIVLPTFTSLVGANGASDGYLNASEVGSATAGFTLTGSNYTVDDFTGFLDDTPSITCDSGKTYSNVNIPLINTISATDDTYAVCVKLSDAAGNVVYGKSQSIVRDGTAPPALTSFNAAPDPAGQGIALSFAFPAVTTDYSTAEMRLLLGTTAPAAACNDGTVIQTYTTGTGFTATSLVATGLTAGSAYSFRVCVKDAAGNLTASNTATNVKASGENVWDFSTAASYTFDALAVDISSGMARLLGIDQTDNDNTANGFAGGDHFGTTWNGTDALTISSVTASNGEELYDDFYDGINPANLEYLFHFDAVGYVNGSTLLNTTNKLSASLSTGDSNSKTVSGKFGKGLFFDGTNDGLTILHDTSNQFTGDFTMMAWIKIPSGLGTNNRIISKQPGGAVSLYHMRALNHKLNMEISSSAGTVYPVNGTSTIDDGTWHFVVGLRTGSTIKVYVDGVLEGSAAAINTTVGTSGSNLSIGHDNGLNYFSGSMDEVALFSRALSDTEISTLYSNQLKRTRPITWDRNSRIGEGLVFLAHLDEASGTLSDSSAYANNGTASGGPTYNQTGLVGKAMSFDGVNDFVDFGQDTSLNMTTALSTAFWVKVSAYPASSQASLLVKEGEYQIAVGTAGELKYVIMNPSPGYAWVNTGGIIPLNTWTHVALIYTAAGGPVAYINGKRIYSNASATGNIGDQWPLLNKLYLGYRQGSTDSYLNGYLDEVAIWNRQLSDHEVQLLYDQQRSGHSGNVNELPTFRLTGSIVDMTANVLLMTMNEQAATEGRLIYDYSGYTNTGVLSTTSDGLNKSTNGQLRTGLTLDGNDAIKINNSTSLSPAQLTISTWFSWDGSGAGHIFTKSLTAGLNSYALFINSDGTVRMLVGDGTSNKIAASSPIVANKWNYIVGTYDGANVKIYLNGELAGTTASTLTIAYDTSPVFIGADDDNDDGNPEGFIGGKVDETAVWSRALSAAEITTIYNNQSAAYLSMFESRLIDATATANWTSFVPTPDRPYGKQLPNSGAAESGYSYYTANSINLMSGNVLLMHLNETSGTIQDTSGNSLNGTASGTPTYAVNGMFGTGMSFDGVDDKISITQNALLRPTTISVSAWVRAEGLQGIAWAHIIGNNSSSTGGNTGWGLELDNSTPAKAAFVYGNGSSFGEAAGSTTIVADNTWHHLVGTLGGGQIKLYVDGVLQGSTAYTGTATPNSTGSVTIGSNQNAGFFKGRIDEVAVWNRALSATEVKELYLRGGARAQLQVRSCDATGCDAEVWQGSDGTAATALSEYNNTAASPAGFTFSSFPSMSVGSGRFFQYRLVLGTNSSTDLPKMHSVTINPAHYSQVGDVVVNTGRSYTSLYGFTATNGTGSGNVTYQISNNGTSWYYHNGTTWVAASTRAQSNTAAAINTNIGTFVSVIGTGTFYFKAFLNSTSTGTTQIELDRVSLIYAP